MSRVYLRNGSNVSCVLLDSVTGSHSTVVILQPPHCITGAVMVQERLKVAVTKVTGDGAVLSWETTVGQQHALTCSLHYGPQTEAMLVKTEVRTSAKNIKLAHLSPHTTYHASLNCSQAAATYKSNTVHFTPHGDPAVALEVRPPPSPPPPRAVADTSSWSSRGGKDGESAGDGGIVVMMSQRHMNAPRRDPHSAVPSTSVILGAVCGVVGFLIINVTVVMAVRQYSHRRARRRRLLELQLEQHGGYLYNFEQLMADYNQQINASNS
ncbi:uncharacterized protein LOC123516125 isoform X1 [Portunus trituberculatus]|uniref:uncharacterized protein LOC123516125 isoform X1 n=1 Tax=Portunus trituberculatus TaxID=210409 RepID=UPI001E1CB50D|nr:uncharacterized protein LOC123516125 isoform X1 [Portunus trituberculatus]